MNKSKPRDEMGAGKGVTLEDLGAKSFGAMAPHAHRFGYESLEDAFPDVDPGHGVFGDRVLVQIRTVKEKTKGGLVLVRETTETEQWNTQVAKVRFVGPLAFRNRDTMEQWPEGAWCEAGDFVRVPKYGGDRFEVPIPGRDGEKALFAYFKDGDLLGPITGDPLVIVAYI